jgi:hypothetical protein
VWPRPCSEYIGRPSGAGNRLALEVYVCHDPFVTDTRRLPVLDELTVVLPQRHRARVLGIAPGSNEALVMLVQDFARSTNPKMELEPVWRLHRYERDPESGALHPSEVARFTHPTRGLGAVLMAHDSDGIYLMFDGRLLRVDPDRRSVEGVCQLQLADVGSQDQPQVRGMAIRPGMLAVTVETSPDDLSLHIVPLPTGVPQHFAIPASQGEQLAWGPDATLYLLDLGELSAWRDGRSVGSVDLTPRVKDWFRQPAELLAVDEKGHLYAGAGDTLIHLSPELDVLETLQLPGPSHGLTALGPGMGMLSRRIDEVSATLVLQTFAP